MSAEEERRRARDLLHGADEVLVLTGAGISADSGVPTFRGEEGLWKRYRPEELATPEAFERDPRLVWEWYAWRRRKVGPCRPNAAHLALARWARRRPGVRLVTQNVDGLHEAARREVAERDGEGPPGSAPIELHGSLFRVRCTACGRRTPHREAVDASSAEALPRCGECDGLLRPDVVWFGEPLPSGVLERALEAARRADACLVVGTSAAVQPAAGLAVTAVRSGAGLVEVNPEPTPLTRLAEVSLRARAAPTVPALLEPL